MHCTVRKVFGTGIIIEEAQWSFLIAYTLVSDNAYGIAVSPITNGRAQGVLDHVWLNRNYFAGLTLGNGVGQEQDAPTSVRVVESAVTNTANPLGDPSVGIGVQGNSALTVARSIVAGNDIGFLIGQRATVLSFGDNYITGNGKDIDGAGTLTHVGAQ